MRKLFKKTSLLTAVFVAGLLVGLFYQPHKRWVGSESYLRPLLAQPNWVDRRDCVAPDSNQQRRSSAALESLEAFPETHHPMFREAIKYFAKDYNWTGWTDVDHVKGEPFDICRPTESYQRIAEIAVRKKFYKNDGSSLSEEGLLLAAELGPLDPVIVDAVANTAFSPNPVESRGRSSDIRPYARTVLAQFGKISKPWSEKAVAEISAVHSLGTGALQVAVAAKVPGAIEQAEALMKDMLGSGKYWKFKRISALQDLDGTIGPDTKDRLYELAYAISMGGQEAEMHFEPIADLLDYAVTVGSHFGSLVVRPTKMCVVLKRIGGKATEAANRYDFCSDENIKRRVN